MPASLRRTCETQTLASPFVRCLVSTGRRLWIELEHVRGRRADQEGTLLSKSVEECGDNDHGGDNGDDEMGRLD